MSVGFTQVSALFKARGQLPFQFQIETWQAYLAGKSGMITVPTGGGKTWAAAIGPMIEAMDAGEQVNSSNRKTKRNFASPLTLLWITPLRALAADTTQAVQSLVAEARLPWSVELRTSDTSATIRRRQKDRLPTVLVTTPESLSLLISYPDVGERVSNLQCVVVDEWHELMGSKRGVQAELGLARLRFFRPLLRTWGLSATIANIAEATETLLGVSAPSPGKPGEGWGEGGFANERQSNSSVVQAGESTVVRNHPHPDPLPAYRERGTDVVPLQPNDLEVTSPSPGKPGEGWGEGGFANERGSSSCVAQGGESSVVPNHPHPDPLPAYREREKDVVPLQPNDLEVTSPSPGKPGEGWGEGGFANERGSDSCVAQEGESSVVPNHPHPSPLPGYREREIITAPDTKRIEITTLLPEQIERFPWAGHLGARMAEPVAKAIESAGTSLVFTNTRSQTELWFRALLQIRPDWLDKLAVHHGSIDRGVRLAIEGMLHDGKLKAVICTSSLDLGVDFAPVDQVIQIGSPKGIARAMQRAGRSGHQPGAISRIVFVPTQAFELLEFSATRLAVQRRALEPREPVMLALDVLAQHLVTVAAGGGFEAGPMRAEVRTTHAFAGITDEQWGWVLDFVHRGGPTLVAYPQYARVQPDNSGRWQIVSDRLAKMHRMSIGTIVSDSSVLVKTMRGKFLGSVEESFAAKLRSGDVFSFAGKSLEFVRLREMTLQVRPAKSSKGGVPRWAGSRMPMSANLSAVVRERLDEAADGKYADDEMNLLRPILELQQRWSVIPCHDQVLIEYVRGRDGHHHFIFPFQGRLAHEGLSALMAYRFARKHAAPITATFNDYGLELLSTERLAVTADDWLTVLSADQLLEDVLACVNSGELGRRHFREIARIAGLLVPMRPGAQRSTRQLQASSQLFYDVFVEFDPNNLLLEQSRREVLDRQLELKRLRTALLRIRGEKLLLIEPPKLTPMAFPLFAEQIGSQQLRSETPSQRIERISRQLEAAAGEV